MLSHTCVIVMCFIRILSSLSFLLFIFMFYFVGSKAHVIHVKPNIFHFFLTRPDPYAPQQPPFAPAASFSSQASSRTWLVCHACLFAWQTIKQHQLPSYFQKHAPVVSFLPPASHQRLFAQLPCLSPIHSKSFLTCIAELHQLLPGWAPCTISCCSSSSTQPAHTYNLSPRPHYMHTELTPTAWQSHYDQKEDSLLTPMRIDTFSAIKRR